MRQLLDNAVARPTYIYASDFKRTRMTAEALAEGLELADDMLVMAPELRERAFGRLNLGPDSRYPDVWDADLKIANGLFEVG